jgi:hypothetical protein
MLNGRLARIGGPLVALLLAAGCGATRSSPDNPLGAGGLVPNVEDKEAGLVAIAPGFEIGRYTHVVVEKFPVRASEIEDEGDRRFGEKMATYFHLELVRRLKESGLFKHVTSAAESGAAPVAGPGLRLQGTITRLGRGSQAARAFIGLYGGGRARAQADMHFAEDGGRVVLATADRRVASYAPIGGSDEDLLEESFNDMARDFARFLVRLSKGEAPQKAP